MKRPEMRNSFESHYWEYFGKRWFSILNNLKGDALKVARINKFADRECIDRAVKNFKTFKGVENCFLSETYPEIPLCGNGLRAYYLMDPASITPVLALKISPGEQVLDMCAAPGGKSLIIAEKLNGTGKLVLNDISKKRLFKLRSILKEYLPPEILKSLEVTNYNGTDLFFRKNPVFDKILLDAPCSAERYLLKEKDKITNWKISSSKRLSIKQYSLLSSALLALKRGGTIVYSTCSLSQYENDKIIEKLLKRHKDTVIIDNTESFTGEPTRYGWIILPDNIPYGPIYYSVIRKTD